MQLNKNTTYCILALLPNTQQMLFTFNQKSFDYFIKLRCLTIYIEKESKIQTKS